MSTVTVRPNSTVSSSGGVSLTGASYHAALANPDSDASYATFDPGGGALALGFPNPTIPAGGRPVGLVLRLRAASGLGLTFISGVLTATSIINPDAGPQESKNSLSFGQGGPGSPLTVTYQHGPRGQIDTAPTGLTLYLNADNANIYEAYLDTIYVAKPQVVVGQPTGTVTDTNVPKISSILVLDESVTYPLAYYVVKVFDRDVADDPGFDPDLSTPEFTSGVRSDALIEQSVLGPGLIWQVPGRLVNGEYRAYAKVAQLVHGTTLWSDWYEGPDFEIDVTIPHTPQITVGADDDEARIGIKIEEGSDGDAASQFVVVERSIDGGESWETVRTKYGDGVIASTDYD